ncbi:V-type proton ATPase subunit S1-like [Cinclus cinclus]|uniref:V-type proton ATPase subunit S1-like n=1 Tax=Cinclus cinclus TaxID=127875 RepID=UPI002E10F6B0
MAAALWALWALLAALPGPGAAGAAQVPLFVWSTERALWPPLASPGGRVLSGQELQELLEPGLQRGPRTVLLFLQDQLSLEDLTAFGAVFGNEANGAFPRLQDALGSAGSALTIPSVAGAAAAALPLTLQRALGAPPPLQLPGAALGGLRLNRSDPESDPEPTLLLVGLPHSRSSGLMGPREALTSNDAVLGQVLQVLHEEQIPYTALLTARRATAPPIPGPFPVNFGGSRRGLLGLGGGGEGQEPPPPPALAPPVPGGSPNPALGPEPLGDLRGARPRPHPKNLRGCGRRGFGGVLVESPGGAARAAVPGGFWGAPEHHVPPAPFVVPDFGAFLGVVG